MQNFKSSFLSKFNWGFLQLTSWLFLVQHHILPKNYSPVLSLNQDLKTVISYINITSGKVSPRSSTTVWTRVAKNPAFAFSFSMAYLTARRNMRLKTYLQNNIHIKYSISFNYTFLGKILSPKLRCDCCSYLIVFTN